MPITMDQSEVSQTLTYVPEELDGFVVLGRIRDIFGYVNVFAHQRLEGSTRQYVIGWQIQSDGRSQSWYGASWGEAWYTLLKTTVPSTTPWSFEPRGIENFIDIAYDPGEFIPGLFPDGTELSQYYKLKVWHDKIGDPVYIAAAIGSGYIEINKVEKVSKVDKVANLKTNAFVETNAFVPNKFTVNDDGKVVVNQAWLDAQANVYKVNSVPTGSGKAFFKPDPDIFDIVTDPAEYAPKTDILSSYSQMPTAEQWASLKSMESAMKEATFGYKAKEVVYEHSKHAYDLDTIKAEVGTELCSSYVAAVFNKEVYLFESSPSVSNNITPYTKDIYKARKDIMTKCKDLGYPLAKGAWLRINLHNSAKESFEIYKISADKIDKQESEWSKQAQQALLAKTKESAAIPYPLGWADEYVMYKLDYYVAVNENGNNGPLLDTLYHKAHFVRKQIIEYLQKQGTDGESVMKFIKSLDMKVNEGYNKYKEVHGLGLKSL